MFSGVVRVTGEIVHIDERQDARALTVNVAEDWRDDMPRVGDSINCHGICLSVASVHKDAFTAELSSTTLKRTTAGNWRQGDVIHCERALVVRQDRLEGHILFGHVDGVGKVTAMKPHGDGHWLEVKLDAALMPLMAARGSVAIDGISLTIAEVGKETIACALIPLTCSMTTLPSLQKGDGVNIEADMLARYVARVLEMRS